MLTVNLLPVTFLTMPAVILFIKFIWQAV